MESALAIESNDKRLKGKSHYLMGKSHRLRFYCSTAKKHLLQALEIDPYNQDIQNELYLNEQAKEQKTKEERALWGNAFKKLSEKPDDSKSDAKSEASTVVPAKKQQNFMENVPKPFADFVEKFLRDFQNSKAD